MDKNSTHIQLQGQYVTLVPLSLAHCDGLALAVTDGELWTLWYTSVPHPDQVLAYVKRALAEQEQGTSLAYAVIDNATQEVLGCTRICHWDKHHRRLEIGYTWYAKRAQRTSINTESKLLLLKHAFEQLNVIRVEFRTHWHNQRSRAAISRLGAKQDGVLRQDQIQEDGSFRDTVVFSIINSEWLCVKKSLLFRLFENRNNKDTYV